MLELHVITGDNDFKVLSRLSGSKKCSSIKNLTKIRISDIRT